MRDALKNPPMHPPTMARPAMAPRAKTPRPMRVLYVNHTAQMGGGEFALLHLVQQLDPNRYEPVVVLFSDGQLRERLEASGVETHLMQTRASLVNARKDRLGMGALSRGGDVLAMLALVLRLRRFIRGHEIDLVHTNSLKADIIGGIAGRAAGKRVIWHVHDRISNDYLPSLIARVFRWLGRIVPHRVVCNSNATLQTLTSYTSENHTARYRVIHCGTTPPADVPPRRVNEFPLIGIVGRLSPWKGQDVFLNAAAAVRARFPGARFQIIGGALFGEQEFERQLHTAARQLQLTDVVEITGHRADVLQLIDRLDVLVHASTTPEPFGQVVIEGMAAGKPVVATRGGGIPEIVVDGVTGLLVPMGEAPAMATAIEFLLANPDAALEMGRRGRQRVIDQFTTGHTATKIQALYDQLLRNTVCSEARHQAVTLTSSRQLQGTGAT